ncbi:MAG: iron transporter [Bacillota bacterium]|nr:iron transporter [Bacillota bacterium]
MKKLLYLALSLALVISLTACGEEKKPADDQKPADDKQTEEQKDKEGEKPAEGDKEVAKPGEAGFTEIQIGEEQIVGPFNVAAVYFQAVDMYPAGKNPSKEEADMHMEADIHFLPEFAVKYGFGEGDNVWPAYWTVKYEVKDMDGNVVTEGSFMPMNASDGPHYGANIKKGALATGKYKLKLIMEPPTDYLLHTDAETGVEAGEGASEYFKTLEAEFDWDYTGAQLQNE